MAFDELLQCLENLLHINNCNIIFVICITWKSKFVQFLQFWAVHEYYIVIALHYVTQYYIICQYFIVIFLDGCVVSESFSYTNLRRDFNSELGIQGKLIVYPLKFWLIFQ